jgi:hypothetical protein
VTAPVEGAPEPRVRRFGDAGEVVFSNEISLSGSAAWFAGTPSRSSSFGVGLGVDCFVTDRLSLGVYGSGSRGSSTSIDPTTSGEVTSTSTGWAIAGRVGVDLPLADRVSFWPRLSLSAGEQSITIQETSTLLNDAHFVTIGLFAPVLVHPATHVYVGLGPTLASDLSRNIDVGNGFATSNVSNKSSSIGIGSTVGGWL